MDSELPTIWVRNSVGRAPVEVHGMSISGGAMPLYLAEGGSLVAEDVHLRGGAESAFDVGGAGKLVLRRVRATSKAKGVRLNVDPAPGEDALDVLVDDLVIHDLPRREDTAQPYEALLIRGNVRAVVNDVRIIDSDTLGLVLIDPMDAEVTGLEVDEPLWAGVYVLVEQGNWALRDVTILGVRADELASVFYGMDVGVGVAVEKAGGGRIDNLAITRPQGIGIFGMLLNLRVNPDCTILAAKLALEVLAAVHSALRHVRI